MSLSRFLRQGIGMAMMVALLVGCTSPTPIPTLPPPPAQFNTPLPPPVQQNTPQGMTPLATQTGQTDLLKFIQTIQVTPDSQYLTGAFSRIYYIPASDRFVVTFGGELAQSAGGCTGKAYSYKRYTLAMQETGESGTFSCDIADAGSVMVENTYYYAAMAVQGDQSGWHLLKIDAVNWSTLIDTFFKVDLPTEGDADPMVAFVDGQIDISSAYNVSGAPHNPDLDPPGTYGTHHQFFSTDLEYLGERILTEPGHIHGSSMVIVDGIHYLVTADAYDGDLIVAMYDEDWKYLGGKTIIPQAHFSTGLVYDGQRFYLAYTDTSQRFGTSIPPVALNIRLAAFDRDWNLLEDVAVTSYTPEDGKQPGRPWLLLHGNRLYVSYDVDIANHVTHEESLQWQAYVSVYELAQGAP